LSGTEGKSGRKNFVREKALNSNNCIEIPVKEKKGEKFGPTWGSNSKLAIRSCGLEKGRRRGFPTKEQKKKIIIDIKTK